MANIQDLLKQEGYLTIGEAADKASKARPPIRLGKARISQLIASGDIPSEKVGMSRLVRWADIESYASDPEERELRRHARYFGLPLEQARTMRAQVERKQGKK